MLAAHPAEAAKRKQDDRKGGTVKKYPGLEAEHELDWQGLMVLPA